jgi:hypothetical protein
VTVAEGGGIFVSYRRQESSHLAGRLYDRLADRFGASQVFIDVDAIEPGVDFAEEIFRAVAACQVLLAIIGPTWLTATDEQGRRRLDDPDDIVRLEVEAALDRGVRVIPILVEGAVMPARQDLPESLAGLARRHALPVRHESFHYDAGRLMSAIEGSWGDHSPRSQAPIVPPGSLAMPSASPTPLPTRLRGQRPWPGWLWCWPLATPVAPPGSLLMPSAPPAGLPTRPGGQRCWPRSLWLWSLPTRVVAPSLAASDPDRAERLARSIADEFIRTMALVTLAEALKPC